MTFAEFEAQVNTMAASVQAIAAMPMTNDSPSLGYHLGRQDYPLSVCDCVASITGFDLTLCRMFNREFRDAATQWALERARQQIAA